MADNEEVEATPRTGNEWEVVQLTASAYDASPGSNLVVSTQASEGKSVVKNDVETSGAMFMSGHFVFPPGQHENLPVEPEYSKIHGEKGSEDDLSNFVVEEGENSGTKNAENLSIEGLVSEDFDQEQSVYSTTDYSSFHTEETISKSNTVEDSEVIDVSVEPIDHDMDPDLPNLWKSAEGEKHDGADIPCEAWWKRRAISLYVHTKEANTFWSIIIAAAVMGLVVIGHRWQNFHLSNDERMGRMLGPIYRLKNVIIGGYPRGSLIRGSVSTER